MSSRTRDHLVILFNLLIVGGLLFLFFREPGPKERPGAEAPGQPAEKAVPDVAPVRPGGPAAAGAGWTITGRIVRGAALLPVDGEARPPPRAAGSRLVPAGGVAVRIKPHPRRTRPDEVPPPQEAVTHPDGRFELTGVPPGLWLSIEIDQPSSALRVLAFCLPDPEGDARRDLGDLVLEPGTALVVRLIGPRDEPIDEGKVLVGRILPGGFGSLSEIGFFDSRREAKGRGGGEYILERLPPGPHSVGATVPGYASARESVVLPREEPLFLRLLEGHRIAGSVLTVDGRPIESAEVEAEGPSPGSPPATTDATGAFVFDTLSEGSYTISVTADGFASARRMDVRTGTDDLEITLAPEAVFAGRVLADDDETPVAKATVSLMPAAEGVPPRAGTDGTGAFEIRKIAAGTYTVTVDHPEFPTASEAPMEIKEGEHITGRIIRLIRGLGATGKVVDSEKSAPIPGAEVTFRSDTDATSPVRSGRTASDGSFEVKGLLEGSYTLTATATGYVTSWMRDVPIRPDTKGAFTIILEPGGSISGRVLDPDGKPIVRALVRPNLRITSPLESNDQLWAAINLRAHTDEEGRYRIEGLPPHPDYAVMATHGEFAPGSVKGIAVGPKEAVEGIDVHLLRGGTIRGRTLDEQGSGIPGAKVTARLDRAAGPEEEAAGYLIREENEKAAGSDAEGGYGILHLAAGTYAITAHAEGRLPAYRDAVQVIDDGTTDGMDLVLASGEILTGRVVDADGRPIVGAAVRAPGVGEASARTHTDDKGRFELRGLRAGGFWVYVHREGFAQHSFLATVPGDEVLITLDRSAKIAGRVRAKGREVFPNLEVMARRPRGEDAAPLVGPRRASDPSGRFEIEVPEGTWILVASAPGFAPSVSEAITVHPGERREGVIIDLAAGGTITGTVVLAGSGETVEGASVSLLPKAPLREDIMFFGSLPSGDTGSNGSFTLEGVAEGTFDVVARHPSYAQGLASGITVRAGETTEVRVELTGGGGIRGTVTRMGNPAAGVRILARRSDGTGQPGKQATTDAGGRFEMRGLLPGQYIVGMGVGEGSSRLRTQQHVTVTVTEGESVELDLTLGALVRLRGRVTAGGSPVAGVRISAVQIERVWSGGQVETDSAGNYAMDLPSAGSYLLMVMDRSKAGAKFDVTIPQGETELVYDIDLPLGEISGTVIDAETGAPIARAQVLAFLPGAASGSFASLIRGIQAMADTDEGGRFAITNIPPGSYSIRAFADGYFEGRIDGIEIGRGGASRDHRIALEKGIPFRARLVDGTGQPVAGAMAFIRDETGAYIISDFDTRRSDRDGILDLRRLRPGVYQVTVVHGSYAPSRVTIRAAMDTEEPTIVMNPGGTVRVDVVDRRGNPVDAAEPQILDDRGENAAEIGYFPDGPVKTIVTGNDGVLVVNQVNPGTYRVFARKAGARSSEERISVREGDVTEVRLTLEE